MEITPSFVFAICIVQSLFIISSAQTCKNNTFPSNQVFTSCSDLPVLQAYLHWNYTPSIKRAHIAYRASQSPTGWVAWAINPTGSGMVGSQAIVAFRHSNGSMAVYPTPINSYNPSMQPGTLSFPVSNISATYADNEITILAVIGPLANGTTFNHVWQAGPVSSGNPSMHSTTGANVQSMATLDFLS
ncbi:cytochrome b561 and DOMON domain-containing protein At5g47530-like [Mangifera indica]|uniref:cytochrome b561 and DOMON domain-containing protein At5g47530-like n=1 Tax=Mangifera indica TaxID=29780 RepID=UPI001CF9D241|nr:cytochrome b561 and DOMON domain-containing protein At5g47530-like [Mangifera indica]